MLNRRYQIQRPGMAMGDGGLADRTLIGNPDTRLYLRHQLSITQRSVSTWQMLRVTRDLPCLGNFRAKEPGIQLPGITRKDGRSREPSELGSYCQSLLYLRTERPSPMVVSKTEVSSGITQPCNRLYPFRTGRSRYQNLRAKHSQCRTRRPGKRNIGKFSLESAGDVI